MAAQADFCVVGFVHGTDWRKAWMLWPQSRRVLEWAGGSSEIDGAKEIDLDKDVVASENEIAGSTYRVTREWVHRLTVACDCFGRKVHVVRAAGK